MIRANIVFVLFLFSLLLEAHAQVEGQFKFNGQAAENVKFEKLITIIRPVAHQVPGTCIKKIPEQKYICRDVTMYKKECYKVPAETVCNTYDEQTCRAVTRYRDDCRPGPSRRVCEQTPSRQICTDRPDRKVCRDLPDQRVCRDLPDTQVCSELPSREVCSERTGTRVCDTIPGRTVCKTVDGGQDCQMRDGGVDCQLEDGGQDCRTVPGDTVCHEERGEDICRQVSYQDQECQSVPRERCEVVPAHTACDDVPYTKNVCGNETVYRDEAYACMKTEMRNEPVQKLLAGTVAVAIKANGILEEIPMSLLIVGKEEMHKAELGVKLLAEPKSLVMLQKKDIKILGETEKEIRIEGSVALEVSEIKIDQAALPEKVSSALIHEDDAKVLKVFFKGALPYDYQYELNVISKKKVIASIKSGSRLATPIQERKKAGLQFDLKSVLKEELDDFMTIELKLLVPMQSHSGEVLNAKKPSNVKEYKKIRIDYE